MTIDQLTQTIIASSLSRADIHRRLRLVREYLEKKYFSGKEVSLATCIKEQGGTDSDVAAMEMWGDDFFRSFPQEKAYRMLEAIEQAIKVHPSVSLYIPKELDSDEIEKLGGWVQENFEEPPLLDIRVDPSLIVGCAVAAGGYYREYSLRYFLDQKREEIKTVFEKFSKVT